MNTVYIYKISKSKSVDELKDMYRYKVIRGILGSAIEESSYDFTKYKNKSILVKPNWVRHNITATDKLCLTTHPNFVLSIIDIIAGYKPKSIILGDAPIQGCHWKQLVTDSFTNSLSFISERHDVPIKVVDFRRTVFSEEANTVESNRRDLSNFVIVDLAEKSYLEPITNDKNIFRVTQYNPDRLSESHCKGKHLYCIARELYEVDYIIALPKAKTHQKTGITNALKLLVGINGDKDYLPHHRVGGTGFGGDCYPGWSVIRRLSEYCLDYANRNIGRTLYRPFKYVSNLLWKVSMPTKLQYRSAGWYGNDTAWRMVMDINKIAKYSVSDGSVSDKQQRSILYICDGVIGGQGDGPLKPEPLPLGIIMLSTNAAQMDKALALQMGFRLEKIRLITESIKVNNDIGKYIYNGKQVTAEELSFKYSTYTKPSPGWQILLNKDSTI